jgi:hypothetical protein
MNLKEIIVVLLLSLLIILLKSVPSFSQIGQFPVTINVSDIRPKVGGPTVSPSPVDLIEGYGRIIYVNASINDPNGDLANCTGYLWNRTTDLTKAAATYTNISCVPCTGTGCLCSCSFFLRYYDVGTTWAANISAMDQQGYITFNTTTFIVNNLTASELINTPITFPPTLFLGDVNKPAQNNPLTINNTGNVRLTMFINATDYLGGDGSTIDSQNMSYNTSVVTNKGIAGTLFQVLNTEDQFYPSTNGIPVYPNSLSGMPPATFYIYNYITIPLEVTAQIYNATYSIRRAML